MRGQRKAIPLQGPGPLLKREHQAVCGNRADFRECLLLGVKPPFLPSTWLWNGRSATGCEMPLFDILYLLSRSRLFYKMAASSALW